MRYLFNILVWIDIGFNVIFSPILNFIFTDVIFGSPKDTMTAVFKRHQSHCKWCAMFCSWLDKIHTGHCEERQPLGYINNITDEEE